ncbi:MAG TPA: YfhO family protein [Thermoanaerobaculia bacterium]|nr:YfhO family protein [Thermoanaerobaculia bacterium]
MTESRRNTLAASVLVALIVAAFADVVFFGRAFFFRDVTRFVYPSRKIVAEIVRAGEFPFWNPYWQSGQPLAANPDYALFCPGQWLIFLPGFDFWFRIHIVLHYCIAAAGAFFLLRRWTSRMESALFGAIVFSLSGLMLSQANLLPILYCLAWMPWGLWAIDRLSEAPSVRRFAAAALFISMSMFGGEPVTLFQIGVLIVAVAMIRERSLRSLRNAVLAGMGALTIAAVQIVPAADLLRDGARAHGFPFELVSRWSTPPLRLVELFIPQFTGIASEHFRFYWGTAKYGWLDPFFPGIYFGLIPIALAVAGLTVRLPGTRLILAAVVVSFVLAIGSHTPLLKALYDAHLFASFRYPEKFLILGLVPLMLFSAIAFDRALIDRRILRRAAVVASVVVVLCAALFALSYAPSYIPRFVGFWDIGIHPLAGEIAASSRAVWLRALVGSLASAAALLFGRKRWAAIAIAITFLDLSYQRISIAETIDGDFFRTPPAAARVLDRNTRLFHQADWYGDTIVARRYFDLPEMYWVVRNGLFPMTGAVWGIASAMNSDIDRTFLAPAADFNQAMLELRARRVPEWYAPLMAMSAAGYRTLYLPFEQAVARSRNDPRAIQPVIFLPVRTNPVFYFADRIVRCRSREEFVSDVAADPHALRTAYADLRPFAPAPARVISARQTFNSADVEVESSGDALLVCSITRHKYWSATIDGRSAALLPVNLQFQALIVPAGRHAIRLRYRNPLLVACAIISLISFAVASAALVLPVRRR